MSVNLFDAISRPRANTTLSKRSDISKQIAKQDHTKLEEDQRNEANITCKCPLCIATKTNANLVNKDIDVLAEMRSNGIEITTIDFRELMNLLAGPDPENIQGCPLMFPDTAFFDEGRVVEVIRTEISKDGEGFIVKEKKDALNAGIGIQEIRTNFSTISRERCKDYSTVEATRNRADSQSIKKVRSDETDGSSPNGHYSEIAIDVSPKSSIASKKR
jgi:hypothetical protein